MVGYRGNVDSIFATLDENKKYLEALETLIKETRTPSCIRKGDIKFVKAELTEMHNSPIKASILAEALSLILKNAIQFEKLNYSKSFLKHAKIITERIFNEDYFESHLLKRRLFQHNF